MSVQTERIHTSATNRDNRMVHIYCTCNEDIALCGKPLSEDVPDHVDAECVVCIDMELRPCPRCGE